MMQNILIIKILQKKTISDIILKNRADEIARNRNYDGYQRALARIVYRFFDKKNKIRSENDKQSGNKCK